VATHYDCSRLQTYTLQITGCKRTGRRPSIVNTSFSNCRIRTRCLWAAQTRLRVVALHPALSTAEGQGSVVVTSPAWRRICSGWVTRCTRDHKTSLMSTRSASAPSFWECRYATLRLLFRPCIRRATILPISRQQWRLECFRVGSLEASCAIGR
jgi:hypothetical protein